MDVDFLQEKIASLELTSPRDMRSRPRSRSLAAFASYCQAKIRSVVQDVDARNMVTKRMMSSSSPTKHPSRRLSEGELRAMTLQLSRPRGILIPRSASPGRKRNASRKRFAKTDGSSPVPVGMGGTASSFFPFANTIRLDEGGSETNESGMEEEKEGDDPQSLFRCTNRSAFEQFPRAADLNDFPTDDDDTDEGHNVNAIHETGGHSMIELGHRLQDGDHTPSGGASSATGEPILLQHQSGLIVPGGVAAAGLVQAGGSSSSSGGSGLTHQVPEPVRIERMGFLHDMFLGGRSVLRDYQLEEAKRLRRERRAKEKAQEKLKKQMENPFEQALAAKREQE
eukprot:CAMPEP_0178993508 /NCGR_PEP_ID=MMETSP0795-20121207/6741_1 /TAXON_ID=88552 /ORGANISM="Amoebophrya sp., Strain Ameob2" /LENGTH=338 /DNA_ID=CAMNT_0020685573 /DNA_START=68 /DNA_END=1081 /DNA_ORIENTATION=+